MKHGFRDWIGLVETAYLLDGTAEDWIARVLHRVEPLLDAGFGQTATLIRVSPPRIAVENLVIRGPNEYEKFVRGIMAHLRWPELRATLSLGSVTSTTSEVVYPLHPSVAELVERSTDGRFRDILMVVCSSCSDRALFLASPLVERRSVDPRKRQRLNRIAAHVGSALRLRSAIAEFDLDDTGKVEAIFKPDGTVLDARGAAAASSARELLRSAVRRSERARGPLRYEEPDDALALWEALVAGRWSLVDRFDTDGARMVVAVQNAPEVRDPRGLTPVELNAAVALGQGRSAKEIGYTQGISVSAVNNTLTGVKEKLGLSSRADLAAFFAPGGVRARLSKLRVGKASLLVGRYGCRDGEAFQALTPAERTIAILLLQGATNCVIAERRGSSYCTVANQIKSVYAKLGVTNRAQLAALVSSAHTDASRSGQQLR